MSTAVLEESIARILKYLTNGLILIGALAWNDLIKSIVSKCMTSKLDNLTSKALYAFFVTIFIVIILNYISN